MPRAAFPLAHVNLLEAKGLTRRYARGGGVGPIDLAFLPGEKTAVVGPNGAGKTTLLRLLAGTLRPASGEVFRNGRIRFLPDRDGFDEALTLAENLRYLRAATGAPFPPQDAPSAHLADSLDLDAPVGTLSLGERRRAALAWTLSAPADLYFLDEPTANLDETATRLLAEVLAATGCAVVAATHDRAFLEAAHFDRTLRLAGGRIVPEGHVPQARAGA